MAARSETVVPPHQHSTSDLPVGVGPGTVLSGMALGGGVAGLPLLFTYSPGNDTSPLPIGQFTDFVTLIAAMNAAPANVLKALIFDDTYDATPNPPAGTYNLPPNVILTAQKYLSDNGDLPTVQIPIDLSGVSFLIDADPATAGPVIKLKDIAFVQNGGLKNFILTAGGAGVPAVVIMENVLASIGPAATQPTAEVPVGKTIRLILKNTRFLKAAGIPGALPAVLQLAGGNDIRAVLTGHTELAKDTIKSLLAIAGASDLSIDPTVIIDNQPLLIPPAAGTPVFGVQRTRASRKQQGAVTVVHPLQLQATTVDCRIRQAALFFFNGTIPLATNTLTVSDGIAPEVYTFVALRAAPFQVTIGADVDATYDNLVTAINTDSLLWGAVKALDLIRWTRSSNAPGKAVVIGRLSQTAETFEDRIFGTFAVAAAPKTIRFDLLAQSYSSSEDAPGTALPAADPGEKYGFGFGATGNFSDSELVVQAISTRKRFTNLEGGGLVNAVWVPEWFDDNLPVAAAGAFPVTAKIKSIIITLAGVAVANINLPAMAAYPKGIPLFIRRTDAVGGATANINASAGETIDGLASVTQAVTSGRIIAHNGLGWYTFGAV